MAIKLSQDYVVTYDGSPIEGVQSISLQSSNNLQPVYGLGKKLSYADFPTSFLTCSAEITYFISGDDDIYADILKMAIAEEGIEPVTISVGNFEVETAFLTSWSLSGSPDGLLSATASFIFFENIDAGGTPASSTPTGLKFSHGMFSKETIAGAAVMSNLFSFNMGINLDIEPILFFGESVPTNMIRRGANAEISIEGTDLSAALSLCGNEGTFTLVAKSCDDITQQTYGPIVGNMTSRNLEISANDILRGSATITKNF
jgi:hypothetical protein